MIKGYLAKLESDGLEGYVHEPDPPQMGDGLHEWQRALRYCPRELVELVNSKACRGALHYDSPRSIGTHQRRFKAPLCLTTPSHWNNARTFSTSCPGQHCHSSAHTDGGCPLSVFVYGLADRRTCTRPSLVPLVDVGGSVYYPAGAPIDWGGFMRPRSQ